MPSITRLFACEISEAPSSIVFVGQNFLFVGDSQGAIHVLDLASASKTHEILPSATLRAAIISMSSSRAHSHRLHQPPILDNPFAADGQFVAAYDAAQRLHCMNAETNHVIALDPVAGTPTALCWHPRESLLAVSLLGILPSLIYIHDAVRNVTPAFLVADLIACRQLRRPAPCRQLLRPSRVVSPDSTCIAGFFLCRAHVSSVAA
jgi:hypothetical protein